MTHRFVDVATVAGLQELHGLSQATARAAEQEVEVVRQQGIPVNQDPEALW